MSAPEFAVAILAAGMGTRLKSRTAKVLHRVGGRALAEHVVRVALEMVSAPRVFVVVGYQADAVSELLAPYGVRFIEQREQLGTAHALQAGREHLEGAAPHLLVLYGDTPLLTATTLHGLIQTHLDSGSAATLLTVELDDPAQYGRILRDAGGQVADIVEYKSCTPAQLAVREINAGIYCFRTAALFAHIGEVGNQNKAGEYYLTDLPALLRRAGERVLAVKLGEPQEVLGVNTRVELAEMDGLLRARKARELMLNGVTIYRPETCVIDPDVEAGPDSVLGPCVALYGRTRLGENCTVRPYSTLVDTVLEDGAVVHECCRLEGARVGERASIGPFARLRPGSEIGAEAKVGNFVETKKTRLGRRSKAQHLAYLGDATIGEDVNIGAGAITCNYDGQKKNVTRIEDGAFIGTNASLVAPVRVGKNAYVAAGSTITEDVPDDSLAIARGRQSVKQGWVRERRGRRPAPAEQKPPAEQKQLPLVLVVDDDELIARLVCTIFNDNGYRTLALSSGAQAVAMAERHQPALIALDLFMPGVSGFEVLPKLKQNAVTRAIPVICMSAVDDPGRALALGADKFVSKPVDARALVEIAGSLLNRRTSNSSAT